MSGGHAAFTSYRKMKFRLEYNIHHSFQDINTSHMGNSKFATRFFFHNTMKENGIKEEGFVVNHEFSR